jgi:2-polyprenyl-3-methyl-5-hydroxy-6-metoxy-1,4-benzoquinol methylase
MATVFMKWLENKPKKYDCGINMLTLGKLQRVQEDIVSGFVRPGMRVLDIGCGTGTLSMMMAGRGASVVGLDDSADMLAVAADKIENCAVPVDIMLEQLSAAQIGEHFPPERFDLIVSTLAFSEMPEAERRFVLQACLPLLSLGGKILIADEIMPEGYIARWIYSVLRKPVALVTWLLTRTTTSPLHNWEAVLQLPGIQAKKLRSYLGGSLGLYVLEDRIGARTVKVIPPMVVPRLRHRVTPGTLFKDFMALFFRLIPPYPKVLPGLYALGEPGADSSVLVTGNFDLTVRRVLRVLDRRLDAWLLIVDSAGVNVWCAAGGKLLTAGKIIAAVQSSGLERYVEHRALVLPQLCANGVDGWEIRQQTGWGVHWGPVDAVDIPAYLARGRIKTDAMKQVKFPLRKRLEMGTITLVFYGLMVLLPVWILRRPIFLPVGAGMLLLSYTYAVVHPWLPGRDGLEKSIPLTLTALLGLLAYGWYWQPMLIPDLFRWAVGLVGLSVFVSAEMQGMSPWMRGEQANWKWEGVIFVVLGLVFWLVPLLAGWR